jgi:lysyl-tRNA synthetase class 2
MARNRIQAALRAWFTDQGFTEVDPAYLVTSPGNETHLHPVRVEVMDTALTPRRGYLHTSPEFAMKKLLAAGEEKIFSFARVWRNREGGPRHRVEFTMLEWYRANEGYETLMDDCAAILSIAADDAGVSEFRHGDTTCDPRARPRRTTVASEAMGHGVDLLATLPGGAPDAPALAEALAKPASPPPPTTRGPTSLRVS